MGWEEGASSRLLNHALEGILRLPDMSLHPGAPDKAVKKHQKEMVERDLGHLRHESRLKVRPKGLILKIRSVMWTVDVLRLCGIV